MQKLSLEGHNDAKSSTSPCFHCILISRFDLSFRNHRGNTELSDRMLWIKYYT